MKIECNIHGLDALKARLRGLADRKIKIAAKAALNDAAFVGYRDAQKEMGRVFDRPTPWVMGGIRYKKATVDTLKSSIDFDKWGNKTGVTVENVLAAQIKGGQRKNKRHEVALRRAGILPEGMYIVPGPAAKMDKHGNMLAAQIVQIMSWFKSFGEQGYRSNMRDGGKRLGRDNKKTGAKGFAYFALRAKRGKLPPGVYQRFQFASGSAVKPVMFFVRSPAYKQRFDFYGLTHRVALAEYHRAFSGYLKQMLSERGL